ncbi:hypothetical protein JTB14_010701 [Gonioctena quinquepunctata]|nr:hypothetical protein JTB14_010701 [Gonioctena quinquepunctata]
MNVKNPQNITAGFEATGIAPIDRQKILQKLPKTQDLAATVEAENTLGETLKQLFQEARSGKPGTSSKGRKKNYRSESDEDILPANLRTKKRLWATNDDSDDDVETFSDLDNGHIDDEPTDQESVVDETFR